MRIDRAPMYGSKMGLKLSRRSVYVGTVVALVAVLAGFATAAAVSGLPFSGVSANQNYGTISTGNTIYAASGVTVSFALVDGQSVSSTCLTTAAYSSNAADIVVNASVGGTTCSETNTWYDVLTFSGVAYTYPGSGSGATDKFWIALNGTPAGSPFTITAGASVSAGVLTIYIADGDSNYAPQITSLTVSVSGT